MNININNFIQTLFSKIFNLIFLKIQRNFAIPGNGTTILNLFEARRAKEVSDENSYFNFSSHRSHGQHLVQGQGFLQKVLLLLLLSGRAHYHQTASGVQPSPAACRLSPGGWKRGTQIQILLPGVKRALRRTNFNLLHFFGIDPF